MADFTAIPWDKVIELINTVAPLIISCFKKSGRAGTRKALRNMGPLETLRLRRQLRKLDLEESARDIRESLQNASDEELDEVIDESFACCGMEVPE